MHQPLSAPFSGGLKPASCGVGIAHTFFHAGQELRGPYPRLWLLIPDFFPCPELPAALCVPFHGKAFETVRLVWPDTGLLQGNGDLLPGGVHAFQVRQQQTPA